MDTTQLELSLRQTMTIGDVSQAPEYTTARMLGELNDKLRTVFEDIVVKSRSGYWVHRLDFTTTIGINRYRIPPRAVVQGLEDVQLASVANSANYVSLDQVSLSQFARWQSLTGATPLVYTCSGDQIEFAPGFTTAQPAKFLYYIRPSQMYAAQNSVSGTDRGRITAVNTTTRVITVNVLPFDMSLVSPAAITSALQSIDVVHPDGWHELALVGATQTLTGLNITVGGTAPMDRIAIGDYVRVADQTDWPCLPDDFHRCLVDATAVKMLIELNLTEKSDAVAANNGNDIARFRSLLYPRVKAAPKMIGIMERSKGGGWPNGRYWG